MPRKYNNDFKSMVVNLIVNEKHSTIKTAEQLDVPLKTVEKWITTFNKDNHCFDPRIEESDFKTIDFPSSDSSYDDLSIDD